MLKCMSYCLSGYCPTSIGWIGTIWNNIQDRTDWWLCILWTGWADIGGRAVYNLKASSPATYETNTPAKVVRTSTLKHWCMKSKWFLYGVYCHYNTTYTNILLILPLVTCTCQCVYNWIFINSVLFLSMQETVKSAGLEHNQIIIRILHVLGHLLLKWNHLCYDLATQNNYQCYY